ncbi:hypothetical protein HYDPIDRAFT_31649 [Hydnomerulius pinastri MD-312]|uniref:DUF6534 domain-containing protein n=1 Tax=Hydnomerulius pinastri MD-312 TaxID=994086 RepID=A0A0C9WBH0_9AGAM|nr:hypothetical protein HYDPIDRAFT_31649 [Hydnomerulius pinastri MD-312]
MASNSDSPVPLVGPVEVGVLVDTVLFGCALLQSCVYYKNSQRDRWPLKGLVALVLFFLIAHFGLLIGWLWNTEVAVGGAAEPAYASVILGVVSILGAIVMVIGRCFFLSRIWKMSDNRLLASIFCILCAFTFTVALVASRAFFTPSTSDLTSQLNGDWIIPLAMVSALVCDLLTTTTISLYLRAQAHIAVTQFVLSPSERNPLTNTLHSTTGTIGLLCLWAIEANLLTSSLDIAVVLSYWLAKDSFAWFALYTLMPGVFANSLLAAIHSRDRLVVDIEQCAIKMDNTLIDQRRARVSPARSTPASIKID